MRSVVFLVVFLASIRKWEARGYSKATMARVAAFHSPAMEGLAPNNPPALTPDHALPIMFALVCFCQIGRGVAQSKAHLMANLRPRHQSPCMPITMHRVWPSQPMSPVPYSAGQKARVMMMPLCGGKLKGPGSVTKGDDIDLVLRFINVVALPSGGRPGPTDVRSLCCWWRQLVVYDYSINIYRI